MLALEVGIGLPGKKEKLVREINNCFFGSTSHSPLFRL